MEKSDIALIISVLAFLWMACWSIFAHFKALRHKDAEKKEQEEQNRELLRANVSVAVDGRGPKLIVKILSQSDFLIPIKSVELRFSHTGKEPCGLPAGVSSDAVFSVPLVTCLEFSMRTASIEKESEKVTVGSAHSLDLEPRKEAVFSLSLLCSTLIRQIASLPPERVWVSVCSHSGEICRVGGKGVVDLLREVNRQPESQEGPEKPAGFQSPMKQRTDKQQPDRLAVLIDAENASAKLSVSVLTEIAKYGVASVKRVYGDWTQPNLNGWKDVLIESGLQPIQQFSYTFGKNSTDSSLIIDAMDLLYTTTFEGFCIVSSDSDFTRLAHRIRAAGLIVYGFGERKTPSSFVRACDKFVFVELLQKDQHHPTNLGEQTAATDASKSRGGGKASIETTSATDFQADTNLLRGSNLFRWLKDAYDAKAGDDGWVTLGAVGFQIYKVTPSFDSRNYGFPKLSGLIRATGWFEVKETVGKTGGRHMKIKLKPDPKPWR